MSAVNKSSRTQGLCWSKVPLDEVATRGSGHTPNKKRAEYWNGNIRWVSLKDTFRMDRGLISETAESITHAGLANSSAVVHPSGSVILLRDAGIGKSAVLQGDMAVSQHFMVWNCGPRLDNWFLYYYLQSMKAEFERISNGSTIKTIGLDYFRQLTIPLPEVEEQRLISQMFVDVDCLIASLERLVAKKKAIKKGLIQELLSGRSRLPGFSGAWREVPFENLATLVTERIDPRNIPGNVKLVELEHVASGSGRLAGYATVSGAVSLKAVFRTGDVLFGKLRSYLRKYWLAEFEGVCSTEFWVLRPTDCNVNSFLRYVVESDCFIEVASGGYGTHMPRADWSIVRKLPIMLPSPDEQEAISRVLADADAELGALYARLDKARDMKIGMMKELLTGRTRLIGQGGNGE
ncbi:MULTISPECIES: restriction endonuclease subunit S [Streptomyces]|uniref:Restriction endonuclease subunit S n=1 Tax=Streptomyces ramulosus TaxID=47762 RepID=A0ABW1FF69_9ACTN